MADEIVDGAVDTGTPTNDGTPGSNDQQKPQVDASKSGPTPAKNVEDDRYKGILADLQKERKSRQEYERQVTAHKAELDQERRRVQALVGVNPKSAEETEAEQVRQRFAQLFPDLAGITKEDLAALRESREQAASFKEEINQRWSRHGEQMLGSAVEAVAKELGGTLTERQANRIKQAYVAAAENDPQFLARHEKGDPKLIADFVKEFAEDFFEPMRRKAVANEADRMRRVPSGRDRSVAATGGKKIDFNNPKAVEDAMWESFKSHGGAVGE